MGLKYNEITGEFEEEKVLGLGDLVFDPVSGEFRYKSDAVTASGKRPARNSSSKPLTHFHLSKDGKTLLKANKRIGTTVVIPDGVEVIKEKAFYENKYITDVFIPEGVKVIELEAFRNCSKLANVHLPKSLEIIGYCAFCDCNELRELYLPENVREIGYRTFRGNAVVASNNKYLKSLDGAILSKDGRILYYVPHDKEEYNVPDGVEILSHSFYFNETIKKVTLSKTLKIIGMKAFCCCFALKDVVLPEGLAGIGYTAFISCYALEELIIPDSVYQIESSIFHCSGVKRIVCKTEYPEKIKWASLSSSEYWGKLKDETVFYVPKNALEKYRQIEQFKNVTLVPFADNRNCSVNSTISNVPQKLIQYKLKADFCNIEKIVLGETTWAVANKKGYKVERFAGSDSRLIISKVGTFWDHQAIGCFNSLNWWKYKDFPAEWERIGMREDFSYDAFMTFFRSWGFSIKVFIEPRVELFMGRDTLTAQFDAFSSDQSIRFSLIFCCGNENGEGATTRSRNSLYSIDVNVISDKKAN